MIEKARSRDSSTLKYVERHHIIPKSLGGTNDESNIVHITPEEHFLAHQLLVKIYPNNKSMVYAVKVMTTGNKHHGRVNNKLFGWLRRKFIETNSGENNSNHIKYKNMTADERLADKQKRSITQKGKPHPWMCGENNPSKRDDVKAKLREYHLANSPRRGVSFPEQAERMKINNPMKDPLVADKTRQARLGIPRPKKMCPHCSRVVGDNTYSRWHGDNCKFKNNGD